MKRQEQSLAEDVNVEQADSIAIPSGKVPWSRDLQPETFPWPERGVRAGAFTVDTVSENALLIRVGGLQAMLTLAGGLVAAAFAFFLWWAVFSPRADSRPVGLAVMATVSALVFIPLGIGRIGLLYAVDGTNITLYRRRRFGPDLAWRRESLGRVTIVIEPQSFTGGRERLCMDIRGADDKIIERLYASETREKKSANSVLIGVAIARLLGIQTQVYGEVKHGTKERKALLVGQRKYLP